MEKHHNLPAPQLAEALISKDPKLMQTFCESAHPASIAEMISVLDAPDCWKILRHAPEALRADIFSHLSEDLQVKIVERLPRLDIAHLMAEMSSDDRADLFKQLPESLRESVLPAMAQAERENIRRMSAYQEGTAGAVMTSDYATLPPQLTAAQAIDHLREVAPDKETIYCAYVVDTQRKLLGFITLKDLIVARREEKVSDIMHRAVIFSRVEDDQEDAARRIQKFDLLALPVVNQENVLVGIVTHDDAIDIITQEHTEDMEKFMAISGSHESAVYMKTSIYRHFRNRAPWVMGLAALGLVSGFIVQHFEGLLVQFTILAAFMPMLADTGGNTGSQSATLVVRALALREVTPKDVGRILGRELGISLMLALLLGIIAFGRVILTGGASTIPDGFSLAKIGLAISIALGLQVVSASLLGALLPLASAKLKLDPAVVASPALTTIVDITGLMLYFFTVKIMLGI